MEDNAQRWVLKRHNGEQRGVRGTREQALRRLDELNAAERARGRSGLFWSLLPADPADDRPLWREADDLRRQ